MVIGPIGITLFEVAIASFIIIRIKGFMWGISSGKGNVIDNNIIYNNGYGIEVSGSNITNNKIYNCVMGISDHGSEEQSIISKNTIYNCREGIYLSGIYITESLLIEGNNILNCSTGCVDFSTKIKFHNNTISNCISGIVMNANQNVISKNTFQNNQVGILLTNANDNEISSNILKNNTNSSIVIEGSSRNNITNNSITNSSVGILIDEYHDTTYLLLSNDNHIFGNDISQNGNGITFGSIFSKPSGNKVNFNRIVANTNWGLVNYSSELVDAKWNWWGSNSDPKNKIYGPVVNGTISNVLYAPWIVLTGSSSSGIILGSYDIVAYLNKGSNGLYLIGGNVPNGIKVLFSTTKGTIASPKYTYLGSASSKLYTSLSIFSAAALVSITVDNQTIKIPVTTKPIKVSKILFTTLYIKNYLIKYHKLPTNVTIDGQKITFSNFIQLTGTALWEINGKVLPSQNYRYKISKREYLNLARNINKFIALNGRAPNSIKTSLGTISLSKVINMYYNILSYYNSKHRLPSYVTRP